jgi:sporulation protein YabP
MMESAESQVLRLENRSKLTMTGVSEVVRFEDTLVVLQTGLGQLHIHGQGLQLKNLSLEGGEAAVEGQISALIFQEPRSRGILGRFLS